MKETSAMALVHERQSRQLCAIHTVNNLLQLVETDHDGCDITDASDEHATESSIDTCSNGQYVDTARASASPSSSHPSVVRDECTNGGDRYRYYQCGPSTILKRTAKQTKVATKAEFDALADQMTIIESRLLSSSLGDDHVGDGDTSGKSDSGDSVTEFDEDDDDDGHVPRPAGCLQPAPRDQRREVQGQQPTIRERFASNHRTVYFGNYSFECMDLALKNRAVQLDWYRLTEKSSAGDCGGDRNDAGNSSSEATNKAEWEKDIDAERIVCGFVINLPDCDDAWSSAKRLLAYVPLIGGFFETGRHWYAVSRLRRVLVNDGHAKNGVAITDGNVVGVVCASFPCWYVIDSDEDEVVKLTSESELASYLKAVQARGGQIFRASIQR